MFKNNKLILLVLLIVVAFVGYRYAFKKGNASGGNSLVESETSTEGAPAIGADLIRKLAMLKTLKIDDTLFKEESFVSLTDFSVPIDNSLQAGRDNPFSPIR